MTVHRMTFGAAKAGDPVAFAASCARGMAAGLLLARAERNRAGKEVDPILDMDTAEFVAWLDEQDRQREVTQAAGPVPEEGITI